MSRAALSPRSSRPHARKPLLLGLYGLLLWALVVGPGAATWASEVAAYPVITGGEWTRAANLKDSQGRFQARQEHSAVELNGFVYLIGGFIPAVPTPTATEGDPEPFRFVATREILAYIPGGHPASGGAREGKWISIDKAGWFPKENYHHIMSAAHQGKIWSLGGHDGIRFFPSDTVFVFTPTAPNNPNGTWSQVRVADGQPCNPASEPCLRLPEARSAGTAVSLGNSIYMMGGVVFNRDAGDPTNQSIRTTPSVLQLDTTKFPLRWEVAPPLIDPREHFNAVVYGGRIWVFHGRSEVTTHMHKVESWAPGDPAWRREPDAPVGTSANVLARVGDCVYSFGGEFIASNVTGTLTVSQVFHLPTRTWRVLKSTFAKTPYDASGATSKHGTYGVTFTENGVAKIMAPGGANLAWFSPMSRVHVFTPPPSCK